MLSLTANAAEIRMATLTVRNLEDDIVRALRIRAAEHGWSAEAEHREILRAVLGHASPSGVRADVLARLAEFSERTSGRGSQSVLELLRESRMGNGDDLPPEEESER
jgi:plasmid stability protein